MRAKTNRANQVFLPNEPNALRVEAWSPAFRRSGRRAKHSNTFRPPNAPPAEAGTPCQFTKRTHSASLCSSCLVVQPGNYETNPSLGTSPMPTTRTPMTQSLIQPLQLQRDSVGRDRSAVIDRRYRNHLCPVFYQTNPFCLDRGFQSQIPSGTAVTDRRYNEFCETNPPHRRWAKSDSRADETPILEFTKRSHALCAPVQCSGFKA